MNTTDAFYSFLASKEAEDIVWFCKACKTPAKKQLLKTNVLKTDVRNTQKRLLKK